MFLLFRCVYIIVYLTPSETIMSRKQRQRSQDDANSPVKYLYGLYQCLHHLSILTTDAGSGKAPLFSRKVDELDRFFMPALTSWNPYYWKICHQTNEQWRKTQIQNLTAHYEFCMDQYQGVLSSLGYPDNLPKHMDQAKKWAKQAYKKKFRKHLFDKVELMVLKLFEPQSLKVKASCVHLALQEKIKKLEKAKAKNAEKATASDPMEGLPSSNRKETPAEKEAVAGTSSEWTEVTRNRRHSSVPRTPAKEKAPAEKKAQPKTSGEKTGKKLVTEPEQASTPSKRKRNSSSSETTSPQSSPKLASKRSKDSTYAEKLKSPNFKRNAPTQKEKPSITRFPKLKDNQRGMGMHDVWNIPKVLKDILVLGDSNLGRASFVQRKDAQICSFPGLKLQSLIKLLENFKFGPKSQNPGRIPSHVVLSVGINDRGLSPNTTNVTVQKVINKAKAEFPGSKISFYQIPFDTRMTEEEKSNLESLNNAIESHGRAKGCNVIPALPKQKFSLAKQTDLVHWSENCANATIDHFFEHLN